MDESEQHGGGIKKEETNVENTELKKEVTEPSGKGEKRKADDGDMPELLDDGMDQFLVERAGRLELQGNPLFRDNYCLCRTNVMPLREIKNSIIQQLFRKTAMIVNYFFAQLINYCKGV